MSTESEVMAAIDDNRRTSHLVIADISADDTWLSVPMTEAVSLDAWR